MGTTLTGTTPQDTYDSLIKVTDNGPLSGSLKKLTDGLGNDSSLSLSTTAASFSGTLAVTGNATFDTSTLVIDATNNLVGIGTATPTAGYSLSVVGAFTAAKGGAYVEVGEFDRSLMVLNHTNAAVTANLFQVQKSGTGVFTLNSAGNVGIGTSAPTAGYKLDVAGRTKAYNAGYIADFVSTESNASSIQLYADNTNVSIVQGGTAAVPLTFFVGGTEKMRIQTGGGISFNGDTAAANALDDYEEGTWTPTISFGGSSTGITYQSNGGRYTKIGRQVTVTSYILLTSKGSATGSARVEGLPFASASGVQFYPTANLSAISAITYVGMLQAYVNIGFTTIDLVETTEAGSQSAITDADFTNASQIILSATYFV